MVFSSLIFVCIFIPITLFAYYLIPGIKGKNIVLIIASLFFYAWGGYRYLPVLLGVACINYVGGVTLDIAHNKVKNEQKRMLLKRFLLFLCIAANLLILGYYKYFDFLIVNINRFVGEKFHLRNIILPIGISFFTFQGMSYVIDVYRGTISTDEEQTQLHGCQVQKNPLKLLLYIALFPQLIAGPIVRYRDVMEQISTRNHSIQKISDGFERFIVGLAKKVIFADMLGNVADNIFALGYEQLAPQIAWLGAICYALQIYFDFMGYSDMAIGLAGCFGFSFLENFNYPYISKSITEFWRRWHMSLSSWFRDYVYIPLGGNRSGNVYLNLLIVFILTGFWHGAQWSFIAWGLWHGIFIVLERIARKHWGSHANKIPDILKWMYTMLIVILGWVLFRANSLREGVYYIKAMFGMNEIAFQPFEMRYYLTNRVVFILILATVLSLFPASRIRRHLETKPYGEILLKGFSIALMMICFIIMINSTYSPFIYFRF